MFYGRICLKTLFKSKYREKKQLFQQNHAHQNIFNKQLDKIIFPFLEQ